MQITCFIPERQSSLGFRLTNSHTDSSLITHLETPLQLPNEYRMTWELKYLSLTKKEDLVGRRVITHLTLVGKWSRYSISSTVIGRDDWGSRKWRRCH
jgi:hypothetical protein